MILVTGAYGFIGSNLVHELNHRGYTDLVLIDDLTQGCKYKNLVGAKFTSYYDVDEFFHEFTDWKHLRAIYHQGAVSDTTETNGKLVMARNYSFTCKLFNCALDFRIPISYASSASVYGNTTDQTIDPLNLYAYSKSLVDQVAAQHLNKFKLIHGWRYFNVYGSREDHKGDQASPITKFTKQVKETGKIQIFEGSKNIHRDFICVDDVVKTIIDFMENSTYSGIRDLGTGAPTSFETVAHLIARKYNGIIETIPFPDNLVGQYQFYTKAAKPQVDRKFTTIADWLYYH